MKEGIRKTSERLGSHCKLLSQATNEDIREAGRMNGQEVIDLCERLALLFKKLAEGDQI